jgi:cytochrome oxidase assembly protein ShyY1
MNLIEEIFAKEFSFSRHTTTPTATGYASILCKSAPSLTKSRISATVLQTDPESDGLLRQWPEIASGIDKNLAYAFQWFALAAVQLMLYFWFQFITNVY